MVDLVVFLEDKVFENLLIEVILGLDFVIDFFYSS